jgi:hypothetical protein
MMGTVEKCFQEDVKKVEITSPIVILSHCDLTDINSSIKEKISTAFGSDGLGILFVRGVPGYVNARSRLLPLARKFTELDQIIQVISKRNGETFNLSDTTSISVTCVVE